MFSEIDDYYIEGESKYIFPYNFESRTPVVLDLDSITAIPEEVVVVQIPHESALDPIGFARKHGLTAKELLRANPPQVQMKAGLIPWRDTQIHQVIERNLKKAKAEELKKATKRVKKHRRRL